eukprot:gb/GEZJ01002084.1/.p1 GENE.gb/GEZJ01002084.1/~~gb/GEZJ01002084.1/.p1  ORF type:complete len:968 (-),score=186.85 gb/GEZJ01002084.1/:1491-4394(-)
MPVTEREVAITERLSPASSFRAVTKQFVDDFIVNEISQQNTLLKLTSLPRSSAKRLRPSSFAPSSIPFSEVDTFFPAHNPPPSIALSAAISEGQSSHLFPVLTDKESRTKVHEWVRNYLPSFIGDTLQTDEGQIIRLRLRSKTKPWKRRRKDGNNSDCKNLDATKDNTYDPREQQNEYSESFPRNSLVNFFLWKRNRDTTEALTMLGNALSRNVKHFSYAGTKDKRAVTTQLVQIRGVQERDLARANSKLLRRDRNRASVLVGNVSVSNNSKSSQLRLGDLQGNRFTLVLRDVEQNCDDRIQTAINNIIHVGFINYFGLQRFGSGVSPTHVTGFAVLRGDFKEVCRRILLPLRIGEDDAKMNPGRKRFVRALEQYARDEITPRELLPQLAPWQRIERAVVESLASDENIGVSVPDYRKAFGRLPRFLRMMYGHAVQSFLWNVMASERIRLSKPDLKNNRHAIEGDLITKTDNHEADLSFKTEVRQVTKEEEMERSVSVYRVLIPVLGSEVQLPLAPYARKAQEIIEAEKLDLKTHSKSEYQVKGTYRRLLAVPKDFEWKFVSYNDRFDIIVPSEVDALLAELRERNESNPKMNETQRNNPTKADDEETVAKETLSAAEKDVQARHHVEELMKARMANEGKAAVTKSVEIRKDSTISCDEEQGTVRDVNQEYRAGNEKSFKESEEDVVVKQPVRVWENMYGGNAQDREEAKGLNTIGDDSFGQDTWADDGEEKKAPKPDADGCLDVEKEDVMKRETHEQIKETIESISVEDGTKSKEILFEAASSAAADDKKDLESKRKFENKEGCDDGAGPSEAPTVHSAEENGGDVAREVSPKEDQSISVKAGTNEDEPAKVVTIKEEGQGIYVGDAHCDKKEDAKSHDFLPQRELNAKDDSCSDSIGSADPKKAWNKSIDHGKGPRRALVISFSLGCAEYATMLVRELTGFESSTAVQKALQEIAEEASQTDQLN